MTDQSEFKQVGDQVHDNDRESVLSWDIGLKNLSYCVLERNGGARLEDQTQTRHGYYIRDWGLINLYEDEVVPINYCKELTKKGKVCHKKSKFVEGDRFFCKVHKSQSAQLIKKPKKKKRSVFEYAKRIKRAIDAKPHLKNVNYVVVENQPSNLNPIMKSVQIMVFSYFSFLHGTKEGSQIVSVNNANARQKEKLPTKDEDWPGSAYELKVNERYTRVKDRYRRRKILCLEYAKMCLHDAPEYLSFLENHSKQDDLTDSFLQATDWFLRHE